MSKKIRYFDGVHIKDEVCVEEAGCVKVVAICDDIGDKPGFFSVDMGDGIMNVSFDGIPEGMKEQKVFWNAAMSFVSPNLLQILEKELKYQKMTTEYLEELLKSYLGDDVKIKKYKPEDGSLQETNYYAADAGNYTVFIDYLKMPKNPYGKQKLIFIINVGAVSD